jgi:MraZ protein
VIEVENVFSSCLSFYDRLVLYAIINLRQEADIMGVFTGNFTRSLDNGRITLPVEFISNFSDNTIVITKGTERCLLLIRVEDWSAMNDLIATDDPYIDIEHRKIFQSLPAIHLKVSKSGRITIPQSLREYAKLTKKCVLSGQLKFVEIWDVDEYEQLIKID